MNNEELKKTIDNILKNNILPFWSRKMVDHTDGGYYGRIDKDGRVEKNAPKGVILNTRLLWSFSRAWSRLNTPELRECADRSFACIKEQFTDPDYGGLYWETDHKGNPSNLRKQCYAQAFGIYALCEYYMISKEEQAKEEALKIFRLLEKYARDNEYGGYLEALSREWQQMEDVRLSPVDQNDKKSNNTHLHIMEAYTSLHRICRTEETEEALEHVITVMMEKIYNPKIRSFTLFFTEDWEKRSETMSFGHDIEASWLIWEALKVLDHSDLTEKYREDVVLIARNALDNYLEGELGTLGMRNEKKADGSVDRDKIWWVQNEGAIGFLNAYELTGDEDYMTAARNIWTFCDTYHVDHINGEWWGFAKDDGISAKTNPYKADEWKCPYHNSRACIESLERLERIEQARQGLQ